MNLNLMFYLSSIMLVFCSSMVVVSRHQVFSLLFLVGSFISASLILFMIECEFLALLFIVIYVGAIAVLFLFAVMMLESKLQNLSKNLIQYFPIGIVFGFLFVWPYTNKVLFISKLNISYLSDYFNNYQNWYTFMDTVSDIEAYSQVLYSYFVLQLLVSGLILLVILIGVVYLTNSFIFKYSRYQSIFKQLSRNSSFFTN